MKSTATQEYQSIIERIINTRKQLGMTQAEVARQLGKHQSYMAKIEGLERRVDIAELQEIGRVLGFRVEIRNV